MNENAIFRCAQVLRGETEMHFVLCTGSILFFLNSLNLNVFPLTITTISAIIYLLILQKKHFLCSF
jgi:hypothetical protein